MSQVEPTGVETPEPAPPPELFDIPFAGSWAAASLPWIVLVGWFVALRNRFPSTNHDAAFLTGTAERWLDGETLYSGITQPNPPLVYWFHAVPVLLERLTGYPLDQGLRLWLVLTVAWSCALLAWTMRAVKLPATPGARNLATLVWVTLVTVRSAYDFGQREDLVIALIAPWMLAAAAAIAGRPVGRGLGIVVGLTAFVGFAMKPFFPVVWGVVELWVLLRTFRGRRLAGVLRAENWTIFGTLAVYALYMVVATDYVGDLLRWKEGYPPYGAMGAPYEHVLRSVHADWLLQVGAVWLVVRLVTGLKAIRPLDEVVVLAIPLFAGIFLAQGKGFTYQAVPQTVLIWWLQALIGLALAVQLSQVPGPVLLRRALPLVGWGAAVFAGWIGWKGGHDVRAWYSGRNDVWPSGYGCIPRPEYKQKRSNGNCKTRAVIEQVQELTDPGDPVAWVTPTVLQSGFVYTYARVKDVVSKTPSLLPDLYPPRERFAKTFPYHPEGQRHPLETMVLYGLADDLERTDPVLITFDIRENLRGFGAKSHFDIVTFYRQDPRFSAILDQRYVEVPDVGGEGTIRWFVRKDKVPESVSRPEQGPRAQ